MTLLAGYIILLIAFCISTGLNFYMQHKLNKILEEDIQSLPELTKYKLTLRYISSRLMSIIQTMRYNKNFTTVYYTSDVPDDDNFNIIDDALDDIERKMKDYNNNIEQINK